MIAALFVAGPAVLLVVMAWAMDQFMPFPSAEAKAGEPDARLTGPSAVPRSTTPSTPLHLDAATIRKAFDDAENAQEFVPLTQALRRFEAKRSRSMAEDHYPDPIHSRYKEIDSLELQSQRVIFEKDGSVRLEARSAAEERGRPLISSESKPQATHLIR